MRAEVEGRTDPGSAVVVSIPRLPVRWGNMKTMFGLVLLLVLLVGVTAVLAVQGTGKLFWQLLRQPRARWLLPALAVAAVLALSVFTPTSTQALAKCHPAPSGYGYRGHCT